MQPFGVLELAISAKASVAPGWALVPDTGIDPARAALQPTRAKRQRTLGNNATSIDHSAKQDAQILRDLEALNDDGGRNAQIAVPARKDGGRGTTTPNVRKILQSGKTFANHLSDAEALGYQAAAQQAMPPQHVTAQARVLPMSTSRPAAGLTSKGTRSHKKIDRSATAASVTPVRRASSQVQGVSSPAPRTAENRASTSTTPRASILVPLPEALAFKSHPADNDPLLRSRLPSIPTQAELVALLAAPPLTYLEAKGQLSDEDLSKPVRTFCSICGYWGRVRCLGCGERVCALECLRTHQAQCYTRYGA